MEIKSNRRTFPPVIPTSPPKGDAVDVEQDSKVQVAPAAEAAPPTEAPAQNSISSPEVTPKRPRGRPRGSSISKSSSDVKEDGSKRPLFVQLDALEYDRIFQISLARSAVRGKRVSMAELVRESTKHIKE